MWLLIEVSGGAGGFQLRDDIAYNVSTASNDACESIIAVYCISTNIGCVFFQNLTNLDRSRFVRRDRSSPVKKNVQIFLVVVGVVILFSSAQSAADHALFCI